MFDQYFHQLLLLLSTSVIVIITFQRLHIPSSLGYLLVGVMLGTYTPGPVIDEQPLKSLAEFGIVFLLFTIGLNFSLPQLYALRHVLLGAGTGQVVLTTAVIAGILWLFGLDPAAAFIVGAVFAQSSTTIISKQLAEQREENTPHGRTGIAMSVFQDVTAVPIVVIIPVLASTAVGFGAVSGAIGLAVAKALLAFLLVFVIGRWVLRPLFQLVTLRHSPELFTLTVLFVSLVAAWLTNSLGLSMAFGAFLAGMVLGETEFRHQVESTIRPFRDVLLGMFFVAIGMLVNPAKIPEIWHLALAGAALLMLVKAVLVMLILRWSGTATLSAWRTGWLLAVGGEFGFALLAIALSEGVIDSNTSQIALTAVLFAMILAPFLIRYNHGLARLCTLFRQPKATTATSEQTLPEPANLSMEKHVILCGYGQRGQAIGQFLQEDRIPYVALDIDSATIDACPLRGKQVFYGDASERDILEAVGINTARLVVITYNDVDTVFRTLHHIQALCPDIMVMVCTSDEHHINSYKAAGANEVIPENLENSLMIAVHTLILLGMPMPQVLKRLQSQWKADYPLLHELLKEREKSKTQA
jgi:CPA2 family monovalent cation:H+ antiporter-2